MPFYDYKCPQCGVFEELATMAAHAEPAKCPQCGTMSPRVIRLSPTLLDMDPGLRHAHAVNEENREAPKFSTKETREEVSKSRKHGAGCGCCDPGIGKSRAIFLPDGSKVFPSKRPWMISH